MAKESNAVELRNFLKAKKPTFRRPDAGKKARVSENWRRPRGKHCKTRQRFRGRLPVVSIGYGSPKEARFTCRNGLMPVVVNNLKELSVINKAKECAIISKRVGLKKKIELLKKADELKITVINSKNPLEEAIKYENRFNQRVEKKKSVVNKKKKEEKKIPAKESKKGSAEEVKKKEEKEEESKKEKTEKEKILTKKV